MSASLESRVARLEKQVKALQGGRPGRKAKPIVVSAVGVCGVDPERDSATCPDASLYRHQKGCRGEGCQAKSDDYYNTKRSAKRRAS